MIRSLQHVFGFNQQELFLPHDLYNMTNFRQVSDINFHVYLKPSIAYYLQILSSLKQKNELAGHGVLLC